jgi:hypothetical protein
LAFCSGVNGGQVATAARTLARCVGVSRSVRRFGVSIMLAKLSAKNGNLPGCDDGGRTGHQERLSSPTTPIKPHSKSQHRERGGLSTRVSTNPSTSFAIRRWVCEPRCGPQIALITQLPMSWRSTTTAGTWKTRIRKSRVGLQYMDSPFHAANTSGFLASSSWSCSRPASHTYCRRQ